MNDKLKRAKENSNKKDLTVGVFSSKDFKNAIDGFIRDFEGRIAAHDTELGKKQQKLVEDVLEAATTIKEAMTQGIKLKNPELLMQKEEVIVKNLKELKFPDITTQKVDTKGLATEKGLQNIKDSLDAFVETMQAKDAVRKAPEDFVPFRRVVQEGNRLIYDDSRLTGIGGGSGGGGETTLVDENGANISSGNPLPVTTSYDATNPLSTVLIGQSVDYYPRYNREDQGAVYVNVDPFGSLQTRGPVMTEEGLGRFNFTGSTLTRSIGTATFTQGSTTVTGTGFINTYDLHQNDVVRLDADTEYDWNPIILIKSDTELQLLFPYTGTGGTGASSTSPMATITGVGGTISVANGQLTIGTGTTANDQTMLYSGILQGTGFGQASFAISQRIANVDFIFGYERAPFSTITQFARFRFTGTNNAQVICESAYNPSTAPSASEIESTTVTIPAGDVTSTQLTYKLEFQADKVTYSIGTSPTTLQVVAVHSKRIPHFMKAPPLGSYISLRTVNGATPPVSNTNFVYDYAYGKIFNRLDVNQSSPGDGTNSQVVQQKYALQTSDVLQSAAAATGNGVTLNVDGMATAVCTVTISATATVTFEGTEDGSRWDALNVSQAGTNTIGSTATATGSYVVNVTGYVGLRARISAWSSGTVTVTAHATPHVGSARVINANLVAGSAAIGTVGVTSISAGANLIGDVGVKPRTSGGNTTYHLVSANTTNATNIKASAGQVYGWSITNTNAASRKVAFHNTAGTPTAGSGVVYSVVVPPASHISVFNPIGIPHATGIAITTVTETADNGSTAVGTGDLNINIWYA